MGKLNIKKTIKNSIFSMAAVLICAAILLCGCQQSEMSDAQQISAFEAAGPIAPQVDLEKLLSAKNNTGIYTVGTGDVLELQMPSIVTAVSPKLYNLQRQQAETYMCRVSDAGTINLPIIEQMNVEGKTLTQIEEMIISAYYPKYVVTIPSVVCSVKEYQLQNVTIVGAVIQPGTYPLKSNEMTLVNLIMKAGGIVEDGASMITIKNPNRDYTLYRSSDEVKAFAVFNESVNAEYIEDLSKQNFDNYNALQVDMVFKPSKTGSTKGLLVIQNAENKAQIFAKDIDLAYNRQIDEYTRELSTVIGSQQGYIVANAIDQLASQVVPAENKNDNFQPVKTVAAAEFSNEEKELIEIANEAADVDVEYIDPQPETECFSCNEKRDYYRQVQKQAAEKYENQDIIFEPVEQIEQNQITEPEPLVLPSQPIVENSYIQPQAEMPEKQIEYVTNTDLQEDVEIVEEIKTEPQEEIETAPDAIILPVKGLNIPFADVALMEGDLVEVTKLNPAVFTVIGLAREPGAFPYPPGMEYNLIQALGFAGGVDSVADPRFVTIYRQAADGSIVNATVRIDKDFRQNSYKLKIKPGDVISVDVTQRTKNNVMLHQILRINFGLYVRPGLFGDD